MPTLYVRGFPDKLHRMVRDLAARRHRSLSAEVIALIEHAVEAEEVQARQAEALDRIARRRRSYTPPEGARKGVEMLREDRER